MYQASCLPNKTLKQQTENSLGQHKFGATCPKGELEFVFFKPCESLHVQIKYFTCNVKFILGSQRQIGNLIISFSAWYHPYILRGSRILIIPSTHYKLYIHDLHINKICKHLPMLVIVCWDAGKFTFHISRTWKTLFSTSDKSMYPFKSAFSVSAMKKKMDDDALDTISMDSEVRGKMWTFREESRRRRSLVCLTSEEKMRRENS